MRLTNKLGLPESIVRAIQNDPHDRGTARYTVTQLVAPPRQVELVRRNYEAIEEDASDRIWALLGQVTHTILQRADTPNALTEERLYIRVDDVTISGQFDRTILLPDGLLQDYKLTSVWATIDGAKPEWEAQLNSYAEGLRQHSFDPKRLQIVAILRDWSKGRARREPTYPQQGVAIVDVELWPSARVLAYLRERIRLHEAAREVLPECSAEERWARGAGWAVMKAGRKTAIRVFDSEALALERLAVEVAKGGQLRVERRPGLSVRCADYCLAAPFCEQWARIRQEEGA